MLQKSDSETELGKVSLPPQPAHKGVCVHAMVVMMMVMIGLCHFIVAICILKERHRLQNCSNGGTTTSQKWSGEV